MTGLLSSTVTLSLLQGGVGRPQLVARRNSGIRLCGNSTLHTSKARWRSDHGVKLSDQIRNTGVDNCDPYEGKSFPATWKNPGNEVLGLNLHFKNIYIFTLSGEMGPFLDMTSFRPERCYLILTVIKYFTILFFVSRNVSNLSLVIYCFKHGCKQRTDTLSWFICVYT